MYGREQLAARQTAVNKPSRFRRGRAAVGPAHANSSDLDAEIAGDILGAVVKDRDDLDLVHECLERVVGG